MSQIQLEYVIPLLPSTSINETIEFYKALGFEVTYQQKSPNIFVALKLRNIELQFFALKALKPADNFSSCYIIVGEVDKMYESFRAGLKQHYGKIPARGIPRINELKDIPVYGVRQFIVVDPSGNYIRIGQPIKQTDSLIYAENNSEQTLDPNASQLQKAHEIATRLTYGKEDFEAAARAIDLSIKNVKNPDQLELFKLLVLRAEIAFKQEDDALVHKLLEQINALKVDRSLVQPELKIIADLS